MSARMPGSHRHNIGRENLTGPQQTATQQRYSVVVNKDVSGNSAY